MVRERQDLVAEWQKRDGARSAAVSQAPDKRDRAAEAANVARLAAIDTRIADIDKRLAADFPDYAALGRPEPLVGRGGAGPARRRRSAGAVPRHARVEADAGGDLHLGRHQDRHALGALGARHAGADARGGGAALRARCGAVGRRGAAATLRATCSRHRAATRRRKRQRDRCRSMSPAPTRSTRRCSARSRT